jgi:glycosyltransferase involved in cell wall biosynthesis
MKIGLVVPHIFMQQQILSRVIFSPGTQALQLAEGLARHGADVTLFTPGPIETSARNVTADLSLFQAELAGRGDGYIDLLRKHPFVFVTLARQVQAELIAKAYAMANAGELDVVHIYTNEEEIALPFAQFCQAPVVFTHHDPFNFLVRYKSIFPKYPQLNWLSMSLAQRQSMPANTNWIGNIYHGFDDAAVTPNDERSGNYVAYLGRITQPKGLHIAIQAVREYNKLHLDQPYKLKIAGKHYADYQKDKYWREEIEPQLGGDIEYVGFLRGKDKFDFLGKADALIMPSLFEEPFGMVMIEALACGTPSIGLDSGAIPEVIEDKVTGFVVPKEDAVDGVTRALERITEIDRRTCRARFEAKFTIERMCAEHAEVYEKLTQEK